MKVKFILLLFFFSKVLFAQEVNDKIIYMDSLWEETTKDNQIYYRIIKDYNLEKPEYQLKDYYKSGKLQMEGTFKDKEGKIRNGDFIFYYENGNKRSKFFYIENNNTGKATYWYENGSLKEEGEYVNTEKEKVYKTNNYWNSNGQQMVTNGNGTYESDREPFIEKGRVKDGLKDGEWTGKSTRNKYSYTEKYDTGKFIKGERTDESGKKTEYFIMEKRPEPKKGLQHFYQYIGSNFIYSRESKKNKIEGKIILKFTVDKDGKIIDITILKGLGYGLDEEAIRVVSSYEKWIPGEQKGAKVKCLYTIPLVLKAQ